jgi:uncharacterized protein CbrC (UPF0167 family)
MRISLSKLEGTCRHCSQNTDNKYIAISRYHDGGLMVDSYCEWCLPAGKAVLRVGADSTTLYDVYEPGTPITIVRPEPQHD